MNDGQGYFRMILLQRNMLLSDGIKLMQEEDFQHAENKFNDILTSINDLQTMFQLARCYQLQKEYDKALETYSQVFQKNITDPRPVYQQGYIMDTMGFNEKAIQYYEKAARVFENNKETLEDQYQYSIIYFSLGIKYEQQNRFKEAIQAFKNCACLKNPVDERIALKKINDLEDKMSLDASQTYQFKQFQIQTPHQKGSLLEENQKQANRGAGGSNQIKSQGSFLLNKGIGSNITKNSVSITNKGGSYSAIAEESSPLAVGRLSHPKKMSQLKQEQQESEHESGQKRNLKTVDSQTSTQSDRYAFGHHQKGSSTSSTKALTGDQSEFPLTSTIAIPKNYQFSPSDILYQEKLKEVDSNHQKRIDLHHFQNPLYPQYEDDEEESISYLNDEDIPDEKDGEMMQKQRNFKNIHLVKQIQLRSFMEINSLKPSQISGMSSSFSRLSVNHGEYSSTSFLRKEFDHQEKTLMAYQTRRQLGEGSFGQVFEVIYKTDGNSFAMKILPNNSILRQHLTNGEVEVMKQLNHKNVIKIYNAFKTDDHQSFCIISELADNGTLKDYIYRTKGNIDKLEVLNMMKQMMTAINYIHSQRIIHRDIKPGNIFLHGISRQIKIGDFGIAKKLLNKDVQQALHSFGTEKYISPEYMKEGFSASSDVWSMGIVFLELLGVNVTEGLTIESKLKYFKQIPPELSDIIAGMLHSDPQIRSTSVTVIKQLKLIK